VYNLSNKLVFI